MRAAARFLQALPLLLLSLPVLAIAALTLALTDLVWVLFGRRREDGCTPPDRSCASVVIPTWNARDLLEKYLPSVIAACAANPRNEIIVVDNASEDGTAAWLAKTFPAVRVVALPTNEGFGGGSNAGFRAARNDIVVLLNNDMRVAEDFLAPLLEPFEDERVFAVACQIFFSDPAKVREETGLTQAWWENGALRVRHRVDEAVDRPFPCFYAGGGSSAFDRRKFLEAGGFDPLLAPFYLEDTDLGYQAWKRGWKVLYQPASRVWHEHRGTIGRRFSPGYIQSILKKNFLLWTWKNVHEQPRFLAHHCFTFAGATISTIFGDSPERPSAAGILRAAWQLPAACRSRWRARSLARVSDTEALRRPLGGYFRDRFAELPADPRPLRVLFLSPYPILPPIHGGAVFMSQTLRELVKHCEVHLIALLDYPHEREPHRELDELCASTEYLLRIEGRPAAPGSLLPFAVREFANADLEWVIHRQIHLRSIDVFQIEYTNMGQYAGAFRRIVNALFEHDVYFQSVARGLASKQGLIPRASAAFEYLRALHYELKLLPRIDQIQVCSSANKAYLTSYIPEIENRTYEGQRAGIDTSRYEFRTNGRRPLTMLFLGSFRHLPNQAALNWFVHFVLPRILEREPQARLIVIGSDPPPAYTLGALAPSIDLVGYVDDVRGALAECAVFVCPILSGSGVRVKLLEAFASGIPCVSTRLGAEGITAKDGEVCFLADAPDEFADRVVELLQNPDTGAALAERAREEVSARWDMSRITASLAGSLQEAVRRKRTTAGPGPF
ncbi:MAG: glycosyltransferase [Bryobacteraceae bacterium]|nr:glycosyltransferase [Bryobacteraceae bacterium]